MIVFGVVLILSAQASQPFAEIDWSDRNHALLVVVIAAVAIGALSAARLPRHDVAAGVRAAGRSSSASNVVRAAAYGIGLTLIAWWVFGEALKSPLERGMLWF